MPNDVSPFGFVNSVKGKIILASLLACLLAVLAWKTTEKAFATLLDSFDTVTTPNDKLRLIHEISMKMNRMEQVQAFVDKKNNDNNNFLSETQNLGKKIDTLKSIYPDRPTQLKRLNTLKRLLDDRDKLYVDYLNIRSGLINYKQFARQVEQLHDMVNKSAAQTDSVVTTSVKKTNTTTYYPPAPENTAEANHPGFFKRLFGSHKATTATADSQTRQQAYSVVDSELNEKKDTIALAMRDSMLMGVGKVIRNMEKTRQKSSALFVHKESMLDRTNAKIVRQIQLILKRIEAEALAQSNASSLTAKQVVKDSVKRIGFIMGLFFLFICLLVYLILRDVTRINRYRKQIELAKEEAEYHALAKHRFLSNMSHEIRTPLQSILGYTELVKNEDYPKPENIEAIYNSSNHLLHIVNEVLDYNRILSGKFTFTREAFDLRALLSEVVSVMRPQAASKHIDLKTHFDLSADHFIFGDEFRLRQILYNLMGNAIKFTNEGEVRLAVTSFRSGQRTNLRFDVSDTGIGLSASDCDRIFGEFEQADGNLQNKNGTGLGLAITKQLVELQNGSIWVKSKPGEGSCFTFEMLFEIAAEQAVIKTGFAELAQANYPAKIWIVDDDPFIVDLVNQWAERHRIACRGFGSPDEILNTPWDNDVEILLIDIRMPQMSGIELCHLIRPKILSQTRVCALTAQVMPEEHQIVLKGGFDCILTKPFTEKELLDMLKKQRRSKPAKEFILDQKAIEKLTFGDPVMGAGILKRFADDSTYDMAALRDALSTDDVKSITLLLHRIAGRTAQIGNKALASKFRIIEIRLQNENWFSQNDADDIRTLLNYLQDFTGDVVEYAKASPGN
jgi:signal transduction histidine kinase/DNA-binding response OmpR family regulator